MALVRSSKMVVHVEQARRVAGDQRLRLVVCGRMRGEGRQERRGGDFCQFTSSGALPRDRQSDTVAFSLSLPTPT